MAADCEQTRARMLELIYGELPAEARAEVATHVAGCAACQAELTALESTRALARRSLAADEPPARARAAILRAAAAAVPAARPVSKPSAWAWLRGKWTLPTFATVGAVAVFLLASRIFWSRRRPTSGAAKGWSRQSRPHSRSPRPRRNRRSRRALVRPPAHRSPLSRPSPLRLPHGGGTPRPRRESTSHRAKRSKRRQSWRPRPLQHARSHQRRRPPRVASSSMGTARRRTG